ncbi:hypothetical protein KSP40_PGU016442 [Platanthera guangdongensis]|uniref:30S ribosomal protein S9, chloroplastic n=1 Tax=Platanthera guangdongensis TaxID=2320717 RepID=A0ABR2N328_9ASPA
MERRFLDIVSGHGNLLANKGGLGAGGRFTAVGASSRRRRVRSSSPGRRWRLVKVLVVEAGPGGDPWNQRRSGGQAGIAESLLASSADCAKFYIVKGAPQARLSLKVHCAQKSASLCAFFEPLDHRRRAWAKARIWSRMNNSTSTMGERAEALTYGRNPYLFGDGEWLEKLGWPVGRKLSLKFYGPYQILEREDQVLEHKIFDLICRTPGPDRAFGDLIAASGITEDMIDSLILLRDVRGIKGLPPLTEIEDKAIEKLNATSSRAEVERKKQEEIANARVRKVDGKGRAYGTGRRKCSVARVWVQPGDGKFTINEKEFDSYFPIIDHRADLLRPFTVTNTLGLWDVTCTVKGGGVSGQVGAVRLGISRALQSWEPGLRPFLKAAGFITRDPRVVERKKPGKAKARKSFQWVKR